MSDSCGGMIGHEIISPKLEGSDSDYAENAEGEEYAEE
jgi:hypothetical protein